MGPSKERSAGQRTFLSLTLIGDVLFGVHFEIITTAVANVPAS